ncbi:hypothetical protein CPB84DRAFT_1779298 [Gymnopilus junonius]|uniref:DUF6534 domain-containing protein n=1 Tax=Gymnopilus junonius TaxID=109634 RepID=A0A9P5TLZ5_GYMJU|nr:hypothetical protein CPB84DRAFT_1779298 [Gymnopilus junonius]
MPSVSLLFGPLLLGVVVNAILYGLFCLQVCLTQVRSFYYQTYGKDPKWIRFFVLYLFFLETANTVFDIGLIFEPLVLNYGLPSSLLVLISMPVQLFIAWRIRIISGSLLMSSVIVFFGVSAFIGGIAVTVCVSFIREWANFRQFEGAVITWLAASAIADLLITVSLSWSLYTRKTGVKATDDKIARIIRLTVQTGLITAIFATADVVIFLTVKSSNFFWDLPLSKLYTNSLLSSLNARAGWNNLTGQSDEEESNVLFRKTTLGMTSGIIELEANPRRQRRDTHARKRTLDSPGIVHHVVESLSDGEVYGSSGIRKSDDQKAHRLTA